VCKHNLQNILFFINLFSIVSVAFFFFFIQVVMQTGDAELEMRGRCSAGQKVSDH
jgi:hypothetical protein